MGSTSSKAGEKSTIVNDNGPKLFDLHSAGDCSLFFLIMVIIAILVSILYCRIRKKYKLHRQQMWRGRSTPVRFPAPSAPSVGLTLSALHERAAEMAEQQHLNSLLEASNKISLMPRTHSRRRFDTERFEDLSNPKPSTSNQSTSPVPSGPIPNVNAHAAMTKV